MAFGRVPCHNRLMNHELTATLKEIIQTGDLARLRSLLAATPDLAKQREAERGLTLLHLATDWPGKWKNGGETIRLLTASGAEVNATAKAGELSETPLHWSASSGDVEATQALIDCGAKLDPVGGCIGSATPLELAVIYKKYDAGAVLLERGAPYHLPAVAGLGRMDLVQQFFKDGEFRRDIGHLPNYAEHPPTQVLLDRAFQFACRAGHIEIAKYLIERGADKNSQTPVNTTALDEAEQEDQAEVVSWLRDIGG